MGINGFCIDGKPPHTHEDFVKVLVKMNAESIALGVCLIVGAVGSVIPQHIKFWKTKSTAGVSFLWIFLGNLNQFLSVTNAVVMKFPQLQACVVLGMEQCTPSLLALYQLVGIWAFSFPLYLWYLKFADPTVISKREWLLARVLFAVLIGIIFILMTLATVAISVLGDCAYITLIFGYTMGIGSTVVTFVQWAPQIYQTYKAKTVGSFSILMLMIQAPGSFIIIYFLIVVSHESVSTWLSYASAALQQVVLIVLLLYYDRKVKRAEKDKYTIQDEKSPLVKYDEDDLTNP